MKKVKLNIQGKDYVLEMDRNSVKWLEAVGFDLENFTNKPITYVDYLWTSLFLKHHKEVNASLALKLMESYIEEKGQPMANKVIKFAMDEYKSFLNALTDTSSEKTEELEIIE